jgi:fumarylacetoacetase
VCLLNDWSARDIQWWEMAPLGPFLAKNFATTVSPWIVTLDALAPYRKQWTRDAADPQPLPYLESPANRECGALDVRLEVNLHSALQRSAGRPPARLSSTSFAHQYWSIAQMLAHHTSGGCPMNVGDLIGTGTISGPGNGEAGALIELSRSGSTPVDIGGGETRSFVEDGDVVILRGWCEREGFARIGFGECRAEIVGSWDAVGGGGRPRTN